MGKLVFMFFVAILILALHLDAAEGRRRGGGRVGRFIRRTNPIAIHRRIHRAVVRHVRNGGGRVGRFIRRTNPIAIHRRIHRAVVRHVRNRIRQHRNRVRRIRRVGRRIRARAIRHVRNRIRQHRNRVRRIRRVGRRIRARATRHVRNRIRQHRNRLRRIRRFARRRVARRMRIGRSRPRRVRRRIGRPRPSRMRIGRSRPRRVRRRIGRPRPLGARDAVDDAVDGAPLDSNRGDAVDDAVDGAPLDSNRGDAHGTGDHRLAPRRVRRRIGRPRPRRVRRRIGRPRPRRFRRRSGRKRVGRDGSFMDAVDEVPSNPCGCAPEDSNCRSQCSTVLGVISTRFSSTWSRNRTCRRLQRSWRKCGRRQGCKNRIRYYMSLQKRCSPVRRVRRRKVWPKKIRLSCGHRYARTKRSLRKFQARASRCGEVDESCVQRMYTKVASLRARLLRLRVTCGRNVRRTRIIPCANWKRWIKRQRHVRVTLQAQVAQCGDEDNKCVSVLLARVLRLNRLMRRTMKRCNIRSTPTPSVTKVTCPKPSSDLPWVHSGLWKNEILCDDMKRKWTEWIAFTNERRRRLHCESARCDSLDETCLRMAYMQIVHLTTQVARERNEYLHHLERCDRCGPIKLRFLRWLRRQRARRSRLHLEICRCRVDNIMCHAVRVLAIRKIQREIRRRRYIVLHLHKSCSGKTTTSNQRGQWDTYTSGTTTTPWWTVAPTDTLPPYRGIFQRTGSASALSVSIAMAFATIALALIFV